jgi:hypothetical protein
MTVDFSGDPGRLIDPRVTYWKKRGGETNRFPLAVLPDRTHDDVKEPREPGLSRLPGYQKRLGDLILQALAVNTPRQYARVAVDWKAICMQTRTLAGDSPEAQKARDAVFKKRGTPAEYFHEYYQVFVQAVDEFGQEIPDYFVSFMPGQKKGFFRLNNQLPREGVYFHDEVLEDTHVHRRHRGNRALFLDRYDTMRKGGFYDRIKPGDPRELRFTVSATDPGDRIAYFSREKSLKRGLVPLHQESPASQRWLKRHCTHFVRIIVPRAADPKVFALTRG